MTKDEALRLAWDALEDIGDEWGFTSQRTVPKRKEAITAIKEALAQPEPWEKFCDSNCVWTDHHPDCKMAQRKPLTDEEIGAILEGVNAYGTRLYTFARAIEAAHGIKENT